MNISFSIQVKILKSPRHQIGRPRPDTTHDTHNTAHIVRNTLYHYCCVYIQPLSAQSHTMNACIPYQYRPAPNLPSKISGYRTTKTDPRQASRLARQKNRSNHHHHNNNNSPSIRSRSRKKRKGVQKKIKTPSTMLPGWKMHAHYSACAASTFLDTFLFPRKYFRRTNILPDMAASRRRSSQAGVQESVQHIHVWIICALPPRLRVDIHRVLPVG